MSGFDEQMRHNLNIQGQKSYSSKGDANFRNVYPAKVEFVDDPLAQGRIKVRIDDRDRLAKNVNELPWCVPLKSSFIYSKPRVGEMVFVFLEDPKNNTGIRYWSGPVHTSQFQHKIESYSSAKNIYKDTATNSKAQISSKDLSNLDIPKGFDVGLEGRDDAWVILKSKEVRLVAGAFEKGTLQPNTKTPAFLSISQKENTDEDVELKAYSKSDLTSTVINLYSHLGKFRDKSIAKFEKNDNLSSFGDLANSLSPSVKGDELIKLLDLMIRLLLTHIHTPQSPLAPTSLSEQLSRYTVDGELQRIISSYVRIN
jgi:hypothetical protein